ncbi:MAG: phage tail protein [Desulfobacterales bacterium]|nr:phage tail protein [Desulfobacterales bacterium]
MAEPFIGEIKMFGFNYAPRNWATCDGQLLPIGQNQALYSLLGTIFGGDGRTDFALPDLRGRTPVHPGDSVQTGKAIGAETVALASDEIGTHVHGVQGSSEGGNALYGDSTRSMASATDPTDPIYGSAANLEAMNAGVISETTDGGQAHDNMQPVTVVNFSIALHGLFPSRN